MLSSSQPSRVMTCNASAINIDTRSKHPFRGACMEANDLLIVSNQGAEVRGRSKRRCTSLGRGRVCASGVKVTKKRYLCRGSLPCL
jgi:hypothetical protein